jgi:hypothetical protein
MPERQGDGRGPYKSKGPFGLKEKRRNLGGSISFGIFSFGGVRFEGMQVEFP